MRVITCVCVLFALHAVESVLDEGQLRMTGLLAEARNWEEHERYHSVNAQDLLDQNRNEEARAEKAAMVEAHKELVKVHKAIHDAVNAYIAGPVVRKQRV